MIEKKYFLHHSTGICLNYINIESKAHICSNSKVAKIVLNLHPQPYPRACLKKAFCKMCVTICGRFCPDEGAVAGYGNRIRAKYTAKWGVQIAGMIFQTGSRSQIA